MVVERLQGCEPSQRITQRFLRPPFEKLNLCEQQVLNALNAKISLETRTSVLASNGNSSRHVVSVLNHVL